MSSDARAIVVQTADPIFRELDMGWFPHLEVLLDGRNSLRDVVVPGTFEGARCGCPAQGPTPASRLIRPVTSSESRHHRRYPAAADQGRGPPARVTGTP